MNRVNLFCGLGRGNRLKITLINYSAGDCKRFLKRMIEFSLQVEARIIRAVLPELGKLFALSVKEEESSYKLANQTRIDFTKEILMRTKKQSLVKRWKKEYYRTIDGIVRSHAIHKLLVRILYFVCLVASIILGCLVYLNS